MTSQIVDLLMRELLMDERHISRLIATAPERYKTYKIKKRRGGFREIAQPAAELKAAQRALMRVYLCHLPVHKCATAYKDGSSIKVNAQKHSENRPILKYDFKDFFPSITEQAWLSYCHHHQIFEREDAIRAGRILFRRPKGGRILRLSIGAPSSPLLSNILLNEFDHLVHDAVSKHKIVYTRYADDMTFSATRTGNLTVVDGILRSTINRITSPKLTINEEKTALITPKFQRMVTGLILTLDGRVSIGRDRKRMIRATIHRFFHGELTEKEVAALAGQIAFARDIEPDYYLRLCENHGTEIINSIQQRAKSYRRSR